MKNCLLTKAFLTKRRHQRKASTAIYDIGARLRLVFGKTILNKPLIDNERLVIRLSASVPSAFGTTNLHNTTVWCMEMLEKYLEGDKILDVGTGAGILAICVVRLIMDKENSYLNSCQIDAFDIYQDAIAQARTNLRQSVLADYPKTFYSTVIANLPPIAITELWPQLIEKVANNGKLILSGLLKHSLSSMVEKLNRNNFKLIDQVVTDLWCLIVVEKNS
ncbi:MAG: hypothetical protein FD167_368 [bacterium]|nr:MAG: hypothetical protein FD167_368 [bacterium]